MGNRGQLLGLSISGNGTKQVILSIGPQSLTVVSFNSINLDGADFQFFTP